MGAEGGRGRGIPLAVVIAAYAMPRPGHHCCCCWCQAPASPGLLLHCSQPCLLPAQMPLLLCWRQLLVTCNMRDATGIKVP